MPRTFMPSRPWTAIAVPEEAVRAGSTETTALDPVSVILHACVNVMFNLSFATSGLDLCVDEVNTDFASLKTIVKLLSRENVDPDQPALIAKYLAALSKLTATKSCISTALIRPAFVQVGDPFVWDRSI